MLKTKTPIFVLTLALAAPACVLAQAAGPLLNYSIGWRGEYQDNIARLPENEIDEIISAPFLQLGLDRAGSVLEARVNGFVEHVNYLDDTFDDNLRASLASDFVWRISDERFHWVLNDTMAESFIDPRGFENPLNEQFTNSLSTGPDLMLRLSATNRLIFGARYNDFYAEETDDDNDGWLVSAAWSRRMSEGRSYGLRVQSSTVEFNRDGANSDYDRHDLAFEYRDQRARSGGRDEIGVNLGYSIVEFDEFGRDDAESPAIRLSWQRTQDDGRRFSLSLAQEIGDIAADLAGVVEAQRPEVIFATAVTGDPFTRRGLRFGWSDRWQRLSLSASGFFEDLDYESADLDQDFLSLGLRLDYLMRPLVNLRAAANWTDREFTDVDQDDETLGLSIGLDYQRTRHWSYSASANWTDRSSSNAAFEADNAGVYVQVVYRR